MRNDTLPVHRMDEKTGKKIIDAISKSNRENLQCQIKAKMVVDGDNVVVTIDANPCSTKGHAREVIRSINQVCGLNIEVDVYA